MNKIAKLFSLFCTISTSIFICSSIFVLICWGPETKLDLSYTFGVLLIGFVSSILHIPVLGEKEISKKQLLAFRIIYFIIINALVLFVGYKLLWFSFSNKASVIGMEITILFVFLLINVFEYISGLNDAKKINEVLTKRKKEQE